jgi:hypothetical protein
VFGFIVVQHVHAVGFLVRHRQPFPDMLLGPLPNALALAFLSAARGEDFDLLAVLDHTLDFVDHLLDGLAVFLLGVSVMGQRFIEINRVMLSYLRPLFLVMRLPAMADRF